MLRKYLRSEFPERLKPLASMGPQHRCCGNALVGVKLDNPSKGFNGAAASMLRKWLSSGLKPMAWYSLQWGRSIDAAEMAGGIGAGPFLRSASMGPQHRCCGNSRRVFRLVSRHCCFNGAAASMLRKCYNFGNIGWLQNTLQWGRSIDAAEIAKPAKPSKQADELQWGRSIDAAEMPAPAALTAPVYPASMGPQHRCCGNSYI